MPGVSPLERDRDCGRGRVLLIRPPINRFRPSFLGTQSPLNLMYLSSALKRHGMACAIADFEAVRFSEEALLGRVAEFEPGIIGLTAFTCTVGNAKHIAGIIKRRRPDIATVLGGIHASALPERTVEEFPEFDYVFTGEGEESFPVFCRQLLEGGIGRSDDIALPGVCYRRADGAIRVNAPRLVENLDSLEFPDRGCALNTGTGSKGLETRGEKRYAEILTSRGCPFNCSFCAVSVIHRTARFRSVDGVVREIGQLRRDCGVTHLDVVDSTFTVKRARAQEIARAIGEAGLTFNCNAAVNTVDHDLLETFARNGCTKVSFGIETGSARLMELVGKKGSPERMEAAVSNARRAGIPVIECTYVIGIHPDENEEDIALTERLMHTLAADISVVSIGIPFPGTVMYGQFAAEGLVEAAPDWDSYAFFGTRPGTRTKHVSGDRLVYLQKRMMRRFYFSPGRIVRNLSRIRSPGQCLNSIRAAIGLLR